MSDIERAVHKKKEIKAGLMMRNEWGVEPVLRDMAMGMPRVTESEEKNIWKPLHKVVPKEWRDGFMFMGKYQYVYTNPQNQNITVETYDYKHGITRGYLHITKSGRCYCNTGRSNLQRIEVKPCSKNEALKIALKDIVKLGATPETKYDEEYKTARNRALAEAGFVTFDLSPGKIRKTRKEYSIEEEF